MQNKIEVIERLIRIKILEHRSNGLFMAVSDDIPGLSIAGISVEEIERKMPGAVRDFLELAGHEVISIDVASDARLTDVGFGLPAFIAHASLSLRHAA